MPYLHLKTSSAINAEIQAALARALTDITATTLGKRRELVSIAIEPLAAGVWFIGGRPLGTKQTAYLDIKVTEGTNTKREKAAFIEQAWGILWQRLGPLDAASYIVIHELRADTWGYQGATQESRLAPQPQAVRAL